MDEMEQLVSGLRAEQARLRADNAALTANNQRLLQENLALREENTLLATRLSSSQPQLSFTDDLNVEAASFVVATSSLDDDEDILLSPTSCNSSSSSAATAAVVAPAAPVVAQLPEPAVLTPLQQEQNVRLAAAAVATECPPPLLSDHALSPKGLTTGPAAGPWALQMMLCYSALWTTMCLAVSATTAATMNAKPSASASMKSLSPSLPLKKRPGGRAWWEEMLLKPPPLADPPPD
jgi:regulator of replication initiation timing